MTRHEALLSIVREADSFLESSRFKQAAEAFSVAADLSEEMDGRDFYQTRTLRAEARRMYVIDWARKQKRWGEVGNYDVLSAPEPGQPVDSVRVFRISVEAPQSRMRELYPRAEFHSFVRIDRKNRVRRIDVPARFRLSFYISALAYRPGFLLGTIKPHERIPPRHGQFW